MRKEEIISCLERTPIIAAVHEKQFAAALEAPPEVIFHLKASLLTVEDCIQKAHEAGKKIFVHIDLADGLGKDKAGLEYLAHCGADGIISTRTQLIRNAAEHGLLTVQRFFLLDSQSMATIGEGISNTPSDFMEIMPGVIGKAIERCTGHGLPVIAGGLIETKKEVMAALEKGAFAVSTGKEALWYL